MQKTHDIEILEDDIFNNDLLDRKSEIENLTPIVLNFNDPLVLALDSPWGTGKTTFVKLWQAHLKQQGKQSIYFNAWETDFAEDPLIVLVSEFDKWLKKNSNESKITNWTRGLKAALPGIAKRSAVVATKVATFGSLDIGAEYERTAAEFTGNIASDLLDKFYKESKSIQLFKNIIADALKALPDDQKNLVIFIDELDRCRPTYAIELLERIKHLFSIERLVFVLSTDTTQLSHSIKAVYGNDFDAKKYLQRFIDLDYSLKNPEPEKYIETQFKSLGIEQACLNRTVNRYDFESLKKCFILLVKRFNLKLRDINLLLMRIRLILYSIPNDHHLDAPLLVSLLILKDQNKNLYDEYVKSPSFANEVIKFFCQGVLSSEEYLSEYAVERIIGFLIAPNLDESSVFEKLIEPYNSNKNSSIVEIAKKPRERCTVRNGMEFLNLTVQRIELLHRINL